MDSSAIPPELGGVQIRSTALIELDRETNRSTASIDSSGFTVARFPPMLGWSHYLVLLHVPKPEARSFYEIEAARESWSVRELERQVASLLFERLAMNGSAWLSSGRSIVRATRVTRIASRGEARQRTVLRGASSPHQRDGKWPAVMPHRAFDGRTPDEVYFGVAANLASELAERRRLAREERMASNRTMTCAACRPHGKATEAVPLEAA